MIDLTIVKGAIGSPQPHHQTCLALVMYSRFSQANIKPTTTYIDSPITGVQMEVKYWVESDLGIPTAYLEVSIPVASATMGHNYVHAGLQSIRSEMICASLLTRIILTVLGFKPEEIKRFRDTSEAQLLELTWHTNTASERARHGLLKRTDAYFEAQRTVSGKHDIAISDVDHRKRTGKGCLLVMLKSNDQFRQYSKIEHLSSRSKANRKQSRISVGVRDRIKPMIREIAFQVRNELLVRVNTLTQFDMAHPSSWSPEGLKQLIDYLWGLLGLTPVHPTSKPKKLGREAEATWKGYMLGADLATTLSPSTYTRHRRAIRQSKGVDIAIKRVARAPRPDVLGKQLCYDRRWEPKGAIRKLVLCEESAAAIIRELKSGLAFLESGEVPDLDNEQSREEWKLRWETFLDRESGRRYRPQPPEPVGGRFRLTA